MPRDWNSYAGTQFRDDDPEEDPPRFPDGERLEGSVGDEAAVLARPGEEAAQGWSASAVPERAAGYGTEHRVDAGLAHDLERTGHVLRHVEEAAGWESARQLEGLLRDSRGMDEVRRLRGDPTIYSGDTHERYVQCILDLPAALDAKQAMGPGEWSPEQLEEATRHEVNRMGYRLNLEIRDRLMNQIDHRRGIVNFARDRGVGGELLDMVDLAGDGKEYWVRGEKAAESPVYPKIEAAANFYTVEIGLVTALEEGDHDAVRDFVAPVGGADDLRGRAGRAMEYVPAEERENIREMLEIAARWSDDQIRDGALDYHARYADLEYLYSNEAREEWLAATGQQETRRERAGDCVARALNEATGGRDYGRIWDEVTEGTQARFPEKDADMGVSNLHFREVYERNGMMLLLARSEELNHIMRKHLDLREVPALLEGPMGGGPLTFVACSDGHAVAVVDGVVHDAWDSRGMGDPERHQQDGKLVELWVKTDDLAAMEAARETLRRYEEVRRYDDAMTYGRRRRETVPPPREREQ